MFSDLLKKIITNGGKQCAIVADNAKEKEK